MADEMRQPIRSHPVRRLAMAAFFVAFAAASPAPAQKAGGAVAFVVNARNPVSQVTSAQLRRIYLGDETRWSGQEKITILLLPAGREERRMLFDHLLKMSDDDYVRHWIGKVFQGEATSGPKTASSPASMAKLVAGLSGAIGFLSAEEASADASVKVLRVDGKAPGERGYPFGP